jgi:prepilin-type N-terminal cleavage/methylation domain-containing protein
VITRKEQGFTLIEVLITLSILVVIVFAVSQLVQSTFQVRSNMAQKAVVTHRMSLAMHKLEQDLTQSFLISPKNLVRNQKTGVKRFLFRIQKSSGSGDKLMLTYLGHRPLRGNSKESDQSYLVYEVKPDPEGKFPGRTHLYRGEYQRVPENPERAEDPKMELFIPHVESLVIDAWQGDDWYRDAWDSSVKETSGLLPQMVRVRLSFWAIDPEDETVASESKDIVPLITLVYLPLALDFQELKSRNSSLDWRATQ